LIERGLLPPKPSPASSACSEAIDFLAIDIQLVLHFNFKPWELDELTVSEVWFYGQVLREKEKQQKGEQDQSLLPHFEDEQQLIVRRQLDIAIAIDRLSPSERLELEQRLH
jgi:hypothetical protein